MSEVENRKQDHIRICLEKEVESRSVKSGFDDITLVHKADPELSLDDVELCTTFFGHKFSAPIMISSMTGGSKTSVEINKMLALAAEELKIGIGVGSQRAAIENPELEYTYRVVREYASSAFVIANIGAAQLAKGYGIDEVLKIIDMVDADALAIHFNPLQEAIQGEGDAVFVGVLKKISEICKSVSTPIFVKETGAGISGEVAKAFESAGVKCIDVSGAGGTSWSAVEYYRSKDNSLKKSLGLSFWDWGIPTAISLIEVRNSIAGKVIVSGGIRTGIDIAKGIALGADLAGVALPILKATRKGIEGVKREITRFIEELRVAMFLTGVKNISELRRVPVVITGKVAEWLIARGYDIRKYATR